MNAASLLHNPETILDWFRVANVFLCSIVLGMSVEVILRYRSPAALRRAHVLTVAVSYLGFVGIAIYASIRTIGVDSPLTPVAPVATIAALTGIAGLSILLRSLSGKSDRDAS